MVLDSYAIHYIVIIVRDREGNLVENQLLSERIQIERKQFFFDLKENASGRFLRITEDVGGRRDTIIVPSTGLELFRETLDLAIATDKKLPSNV